MRGAYLLIEPIQEDCRDATAFNVGLGADVGKQLAVKVDGAVVEEPSPLLPRLLVGGIQERVDGPAVGGWLW